MSFEEGMKPARAFEECFMIPNNKDWAKFAQGKGIHKIISTEGSPADIYDKIDNFAMTKNGSPLFAMQAKTLSARHYYKLKFTHPSMTWDHFFIRNSTLKGPTELQRLLVDEMDEYRFISAWFVYNHPDAAAQWGQFKFTYVKMATGKELKNAYFNLPEDVKDRLPLLNFKDGKSMLGIPYPNAMNLRNWIVTQEEADYTP